jgi:membrane-bound lytic murein transglycosylase D
MALMRTDKIMGQVFSIRGMARIALVAILLGFVMKAEIDPVTSYTSITEFFNLPTNATTAIPVTEIVTSDKIEAAPTAEPTSAPASNLFSVPAGFENRVSFWVDIYSKYTAEDAVFHDSQNLSRVYKVVDLRPIMSSNLHPFVKEHRAKKLIEKERASLLANLRTLKKNFTKTVNQSLKNEAAKNKNIELYELLGRPKKVAVVNEAIENLRMQLGQKSFVEKALVSSDLYLPIMEKIFEQKGLPIELTRMPFVESSFNLAARSRVGASGIWQIMPATGRKLMPNEIVDYRNDPIKATEFAASLLKFNFKVIGTWPLAITAYNHGPTSIVKLTRKYKTKDLPTLINKVYGSHAFAFASSNFYACFLAMLEVERNREKYFPEIPRQLPIEFTSIQLKKSINYKQLLSWFDKDAKKADQFNPHLASSVKRGSAKIPAGTYLYVPSILNELASKDFPRLARKI